MQNRNRLYYFAYGSNMSSRRLRQRLPSAEPVGPVTAPDHQVVFHKVGSRDGTGKCGLVSAPGARAHGVLYSIEDSAITRLHDIEGVGQGYEAITLTVNSQDGEPLSALSYFATLLNPVLRPLDWYMRHVLTGAEEHRLPGRYIDMLRQIETQPDGDRQRRELETSIYR